ncbi:citrate synthase [Deinobacterium chartae]|uniref:citrate synthase (unknown stereospecificity) n=1 Tax=Deinobacterium chartae TaxID=521158 RepID=A0A841I5Y4_9DEIO|nr:citrate synthase family protein [Deinobacterium chartae]MBB6099868.1 citrate synthase [Deinobacterium chartae]
MSASPYLSAEEAAALLGVSRATLYAYVSRGLLSSQTLPGPGRQRRYPREEVERLLAQRSARKDPASATLSALHWGEPTLESAITLFEDGQLYYRGHDATELALSAHLEQVAALLWTGRLEAHTALFGTAPQLPPPAAATLEACAQLPPLERLGAVLLAAGPLDPRAYDLRPEAVAASAARLLGLLFRAAGADPAAGEPLAQALARAWAPADPALAGVLEVALILCADHELNVSSFSARTVASSAAPLYAALTAGLCALQGHRHGGQTERTVDLLHEAAALGGREAVAARLRRGDPLPGFGHRLYPQGDPRARTLLARLNSAYGHALQLPLEVAEAALEATLERPNIDFALAALQHAAGLGSGLGLTVFALGRTLGWAAHALEAYAENRLIRPRARYVGVAPRQRR